ncbi:MAG: toll/interleukin-1 receptor domain-containing protein [Verrucomicrobia bacterium]|nr:toll/interleukin-1 receptor domain-containing protein [Verrucomicrobiota bacterium]
MRSRKDFFISYARADEDKANWIVSVLEAGASPPRLTTATSPPDDLWWMRSRRSCDYASGFSPC